MISSIRAFNSAAAEDAEAGGGEYVLVAAALRGTPGFAAGATT